MDMLHPSFCPACPGLKKTVAKTPKLQQAGKTDSALVLSSEKKGRKAMEHAGQKAVTDDATEQ